MKGINEVNKILKRKKPGGKKLYELFDKAETSKNKKLLKKIIKEVDDSFLKTDDSDTLKAQIYRISQSI